MPRARLFLHPSTKNFGKTDPIRVTLADAGWDWSEGEMSPDEAKQHGGHLTNNFPLLEVDGQYLTHQTAILRFIGRKSGLYPATIRTLTDIGAAADIDTLISCCEDLVGLVACEPIWVCIAVKVL